MKRLGLVLFVAVAAAGSAHAAALGAHPQALPGLALASVVAASNPPVGDTGPANVTLPPGLHSALSSSLARDASAASLVWSEQKATASDGTPTGTFGYSVAISGHTALIGVQIRRAAYVFTESDGVWTETQKLTTNDGEPNDDFGSAVALHGTRAVISSYVPISGDIPLRNAVYVFDESGGVWTQTAKLMAHAEPSTERFGRSVAISDSTLLVGAYEATLDPYKPKAGAAYVFTESGGTWTLTQTLSASDGKADEQFGMAVALSGSTALIGARQATLDRDVPRQGAAYVFDESGGAWTQTQKLSAGAAGGADYFFGASVALSGTRALIGSPNVFGNGQFQGAAYVFAKSEAGWTHQQKLISRNGGGTDQFGISVALSDSAALVGAYLAKVDANDQQGAAFLFTESAGRWTQTQKFVASDGAGNSQFGWVVALDGATALIGAHLSNVDGNSLQGAAYFYSSHAAAAADLSAASLRFVLQPGEADSLELGIANVGGETLDYAIAESPGAAAIPLHPYAGTAIAQPSHNVSASGTRGSRASAPWLARLTGAGLSFELDDGSYEDTVTLNHGNAEAAAIWLNRFSPPLGAGAFTLDSISILWPQNEAGSLLGKQVNLLAYHDADRIGDPTRAVRLGGDHRVTIDSLDGLVDYPVNFSVPGDGDLYIGFENSYARGDTSPKLYPAALDMDAPQGRSWLVGNGSGDPDADHLGNNGYLGIIESFGMSGNWLIRATGADAANDCVAVSDVSWLSVTPAQGSIAVGATHAVALAADTAGLALGDYAALLCLVTNDPARPLIRVPVSLHVGPDDTLFRDGFDATP